MSRFMERRSFHEPTFKNISLTNSKYSITSKRVEHMIRLFLYSKSDHEDVARCTAFIDLAKVRSKQSRQPSMPFRPQLSHRFVKSMSLQMSAYTFHGARNTISTLISRLAASVIVLFVATSLLIAAWSPRAASPLISKTDWIVEGQASQNVKPDRFEVRDSIRNSPETVYWRTWSPQTGATN